MYKVLSDVDLTPYNSLKVSARAKFFAQIDTVEDLSEILSSSVARENRVLPLGGGCNTLFIKDFDGLVLRVNLKGISVVEEDEKSAIVEAYSGEVWHDLVSYTVERGLGGIENLALIPGLVGAAPIQNIAAYGENYSDVAHSLEAVEISSGNSRDFSYDECEFTYRESIFKERLSGKYIVTKVRIKLNKQPQITTEYWSRKHGSVKGELEKFAKEPYSIKDVFNAVVRLRQNKFPDQSMFGTAGSFFKNPLVSREKLKELQQIVPDLQYYPPEQLHYIPNVNPDRLTEEYVKVAAGQLLDEGLGLKGYWRGNVGLHEKHALILATNGKATPEEVYQFALWVQEQFFSKFGVKLENEVRFLS